MKEKISLKINAMFNVSKQLCSVIFPLITIPYVSRILLAENYGKYSFGNSIISYFSLIAALGVSAYAVREGSGYRENRAEMNKFCCEIYSINCISTFVAYLLLLILLICPTNLASYKKLLVIQSLVIFLTTIGADWINTIYEDYLYITIRYVIFQILSIIAMFVFVKDSSDYIVYAGITVAANAGANVLNRIHISKYVDLKFTFKLNLKRHLKPLILLFSNTIAVTIYVNSDTTLLGLLVGDYASGLYSIASKIYIIIKQVLNAVVLVSVPRLSIMVFKDQTYKFELLLNKIVLMIYTIVLPAITGLFFMGRDVIMVISGKEYLLASSALQILSIALFFSVFACLFTNCVMLPYKQDKLFLTATSLGAIVNIFLNFYFIPKYSYNGAAITTVIAELVVCFISYRYTKNHFAIQIDKKNVISVIIGCISVGLICSFVNNYFNNLYLRVLINVITSVCFYALILVIFKNDVIKEFISTLKKLSFFRKG